MRTKPKSAGAVDAAAKTGCPGAVDLCGGRRRAKLLVGSGVALIFGVWLVREPLERRIFMQGVLANDAPTDEQVQEMIQDAPDPQAALLAAWNGGKISQRVLALRKIPDVVRPGQPLPATLRAVLLAAALDADVDAREIALSALDERNDPELAALCALQLNDFDPEIRLVGLMHMKKLVAGVGVPLAAPMLNNTNPQIAAYAVKLLEGWSGENFGVKLGDAVPVEDAKTGLMGFDEESYRKTQAAASRATAWWEQHKAEFHPIQYEIPSGARAALKPVYAGDFELPGIDSKPIRLSAFRGKVVVINFWATWCTACLSELPELIALQKNHIEHLEILGVSLDAVPDDDNREVLPGLEAVRNKVARTVKLRGINYPVLVDEKNALGGRFNGGELPTTLVLDAQGRIRRRFVGARSLDVFESMVSEASRPAPAIQSAPQTAVLGRD